jgi:hypothetical protein
MTVLAEIRSVLAEIRSARIEVLNVPRSPKLGLNNAGQSAYSRRTYAA